MTGWTREELGFDSQQRQEISPISKRPDRIWCPNKNLASGYRDWFLCVQIGYVVTLTTHIKRGGTAHNYTSSRLYVFVTGRLVTLAEYYLY